MTNPDYMHWYGWVEVKVAAARIKENAERLRREHNRRWGLPRLLSYHYLSPFIRPHELPGGKNMSPHGALQVGLGGR